MQIKRNETLYGTLNEALNGFQNGDVSAVTDGDIVVSRYATGSVLGVVNIKQDEKHYWTLYPSVDRIQYRPGGQKYLPDVDFAFNYNAKLYDSTTYSIPNHEDAHYNTKSLTFGSSEVTAFDGSTLSLSISSAKNDYTVDNYLYKSSSDQNLTMVAKMTTTADYKELFRLKYSSGYNYLFQVNNTFSRLLTTYSEKKYYTQSGTQNIQWLRVNTNGNVDYGNETTETYGDLGGGISWTAGTPQSFVWFDGYGSGYVSDFSWFYLSPNTLTDDQIQEVIEYNEGL